MHVFAFQYIIKVWGHLKAQGSVFKSIIWNEKKNLFFFINMYAGTLIVALNLIWINYSYRENADIDGNVSC